MPSKHREYAVDNLYHKAKELGVPQAGATWIYCEAHKLIDEERLLWYGVRYAHNVAEKFFEAGLNRGRLEKQAVIDQKDAEIAKLKDEIVGLKAGLAKHGDVLTNIAKIAESAVKSVS